MFGSDDAVTCPCRFRSRSFWSASIRSRARKTTFPPERELSRVFTELTFERGLVTYPCAGTVRGVAGDTILMAPPLITTKAQIDEMMAILHSSLQAFEAQVLGA